MTDKDEHLVELTGRPGLLHLSLQRADLTAVSAAVLAGLVSGLQSCSLLECLLTAEQLQLLRPASRLELNTVFVAGCSQEEEADMQPGAVRDTRYVQQSRESVYICRVLDVASYLVSQL